MDMISGSDVKQLEVANSAWKQTCKVLLQSEIGDLKDYEGYLKQHMGPLRTRTSSLSNIPLTTGDDDKRTKACFISDRESREFLKRTSKPIDLDSLKDLDSLISSLKERFCYSGDIVLGNSADYSRVQRDFNILSVTDSQDVSDSRHVAYSSMLRYSTYTFGSDCIGETDFIIWMFQGWKSKRCMELLNAQYCNDVYFSSNIRYCNDVMFSFNQEGKNFMIGNLALLKQKFLSLKKKLLEDISSTLKSKKKIIGIHELLGSGPALPSPSTPSSWKLAPNHFTKPVPAPVESAFQSTTQVLFGKKLSGISNYSQWLMENVRAPPKALSAISGKELLVLPILVNHPLRSTGLTLEEAFQKGKSSISPAALENLTISNAIPSLRPIAYSTSDVAVGKNHCVEDIVSFGSSINCYAGSTVYECKCCAFGCWPHGSENTFGTDHLFYSKSCIKCYRSLNLTRCFEVDSSRNCTDSLFCHNCEGLENCMFCFNSKSLRYAIGNVEVGKEKFLAAKALVQKELLHNLERSRSVPWNIYTIGERKGD